MINGLKKKTRVRSTRKTPQKLIIVVESQFLWIKTAIKNLRPFRNDKKLHALRCSAQITGV
jgi:hypothetical protein